MTRKYFGTDGVRGQSNKAPMDAQTILRIGMAAGAYFRRGDHRHSVVIGKDTRLSGYMVEPALTSGLIAMGMDVFLLGPMPSPGVAMSTQSLRADFGVMISASHNPYSDNGIKFFDHKGNKLSDEIELEIEALMGSDLEKYMAPPAELGRTKRLDDAQGRYIQYVKQTFPSELSLDGFKIVVDCSNGAAYKLAPAAIWELGAEVISVGVSPDGFNINKECGSTYPNHLRQKVLEHNADIGIALDGDADRLIMCDEKGQEINGDKLLTSIALDWKKRDQLRGGGLVATVMSNLGMENCLASEGLTLFRSKVGDRYVIEKMKESGCNLGGEQSGHIICSDYSTTGDGLLAALQVLAVLARCQKPASEILHPFSPMPQIMKNVQYTADHADLLEYSSVKKMISDKEEELKQQGRILIRKSGTEPLIRVMAEGEDQQQINLVVDEIADHMRQVQK